MERNLSLTQSRFDTCWLTNLIGNALRGPAHGGIISTVARFTLAYLLIEAANAENKADARRAQGSHPDWARSFRDTFGAFYELVVDRTIEGVRTVWWKTPTHVL